jgi:hypothetical protein
VLAQHKFEGGRIVGPDPNETPDEREKNQETTADLDPGERDVMTFEFVIPAEITMLKAMGYVKDPQTKLGYVFETLVDVDKPKPTAADDAIVS